MQVVYQTQIQLDLLYLSGSPVVFCILLESFYNALHFHPIFVVLVHMLNQDAYQIPCQCLPLSVLESKKLEEQIFFVVPDFRIA